MADDGSAGLMTVNNTGDNDSTGWGASDDWGSGGDWGSGDWGADDADAGGWGDDGPSEFVMPGLSLGGNSTAFVNKVVIAILLFVVGCALLGLVLDHKVARRKLKGPAVDRPRGWVLGMLIASYVLLAPGLICTLFAFKIASLNGIQTLKDNVENMLEFTHELWQVEAYFGAICVVTFAMVIPVLKLILLCLGGIMRHSRSEAQVDIARKSIHFVQIISKWASPDMFAYILLLYLIRNLNHPPILNGLMELDVGFTCFAFFCIFSTICSLGVRSPARTAEEKKMMAPWSPSPPITLALAVSMSIVFTVCLVTGMRKHMMGLRIDFQALADSGEISAEMLPMIRDWDIANLAKDDVALLDCIRELWNWTFPADKPTELNLLLAWIMFAIFVVGFTIVDMVILAYLAVTMQVTNRKPKFAIQLTKVFRKLSMLDVCVVGVMVIVFAGKVYEKMGVLLSIHPGLWWLGVAEIAHYVLHYSVLNTALKNSLKDPLSDSESPSESEEDTTETASRLTE